MELPAFAKDLTHEQMIVYAVVFVAICLPIALWRRERVADVDLPVGDWKRLPALYKFTWRLDYLLETSLGQLLSLVFARSSRRYVELIEISSLPLTARRVFVCKSIVAALSGGIGAAVAFFALDWGYLPRLGITAGASFFGWILPSIALASAAQARQVEIVRALPFAIDLIGSAMRAGLEFGAAMRYYAGLGTGGALEEEFMRVSRDATLGKPISESLQDMARRVRIKTFTAFAAVVAYGTEIGASISETLKIHGEEMRRARFSIAEQKAARAPSVMIFPLAVFILPAVFLIIFVPVILQFKATQG